ncbi:MAG: mechanosensitive ion channel [Flavobacteriaceae bacterium]|nr:mechanosensitive ion channel [Flavobacteriaceae bacterium]
MELIREFLNYKLFSTESISITVWQILLVLVAFIFTGFFLRVVRNIVTRKLESDDKNKFISIFKFVKYVVYILVVIITLSSSGVDVTVLLTASAAIFVGLGFALQNLFQDIISGILIIIDKSLHVGDIIEIDGKVGKVTDIRLRTTRALTRDDKVLVIPNHNFLTEVLYNYTQNQKSTRESIKVGVAYGSDVRLVEKLLLSCANKQRGILKKPAPMVLFEDFGDSSLNFGLFFYVSDSFGDPKIKSDLRFAIDQIFRENNITIPFPQRDVHLFQTNK